MGINDILRKGFFEGYAAGNLDAGSILVCIVCTAAISAYIYAIYRMLNRNSFYNRNFNLSLIVIAIITAAIILTIQSNIVVSLGMVGALSIVRFRTAVKDPMDLAFLFWSISIGIICGAGFAIIAVIASIAITIAVVLFNILPGTRETLVLVIDALSYHEEEAIMQVINENCQYSKTKARNISKNGLNLAVEVRVQNQKMLIDRLMNIESITNASLVEHNGDIVV